MCVSLPALFRHRELVYYLAYNEMDYLVWVQSTFSASPSSVLGDDVTLPELELELKPHGSCSKPRRSFFAIAGISVCVQRCRYFFVRMEIAKHVTRNIPG